MRWPGTKRKIEELVRLHYAELYAFAYRLTGSSQSAEDLTQETFCQAQTKLAQLREGSKARSWLYTILRNLYLHQLRDRKNESLISLDAVPEVVERVQDPFPEVDSKLLQQALNELAESFRTPVILFYFDDFSYREIAEQLDLPIGTVMSRLARAKAWLKNRLLQSAALVGVEGHAEEM